MARINLLPWRKEQRERRNKEFNVLIAAAAGLALVVVLLAYSLLNKDLSNQQEANSRIEEANAQLDVALKSIEDLEAQREQMLSQMKVIQDLQGRRSIPVRVWDDMAKAIPYNMYLVNIKREADVITITGFADNANVVAGLVRNLNMSEWLDGSAVVSIKSKIEAYQEKAPQRNADPNSKEPARPVFVEDNYSEFVVTTKIQYPTDKKDEANAEGVEVGSDVMPADGEMPEVLAIGVDNVATGDATTGNAGVVTPTESAPEAQPQATEPAQGSPANETAPAEGTQAPAGGNS